MDKRKQRTLAKEISYSGIGIHTGSEVHIRLVPMQEHTGVVFQRIDLPDRPIIPARLPNVCDTSRSTTIGVGSAKIHTVEHLLAALKANQIDNVKIEISNIEPPVANGSSDVFVDLIEQAGVIEQSAYSSIVKIEEPLSYSDGEIHLVALPSDEFRVSYTLNYPDSSVLRGQYHSLAITNESFKKEIASCRTFSLYEEVSFLIDRGLIKGASLDNAVVIKDNIAFSKGGLNFPNEMARHKILDLIGDFSLIGYDFRAHIIAIRSGHATNYAFAKKILNYIQNKEGSRIMKKHHAEPLYDIKQIMELLPQRYPFLLVDKILELDLEKGTIIGQKNTTINEAFFQGHFPHYPIMPGFLLLEALAQVCGILLKTKLKTDKLALLLNVNNAKFRAPVLPGDVILLKAKALHISGKGGRMEVEAIIKEQTLAVEAELSLVLISSNQI